MKTQMKIDMKRGSFCRSLIVAGAALTLTLLGMDPACSNEENSGESATPGRPNIVWIISEDNSKHYLRHFDSDGAPTPNIEAMAKAGFTFDRAFSNAPVCSVARTTLITGCYAPRIGTQFHRHLKLASLPDGLKMFPEILRQAGYHTSNQAKEDYNASKSADVWDQSGKQASWTNRPNSTTPFFHVRTLTTTHESGLHFSESEMQKPTSTDPKSVALQPYFPDTELFRYTRAKYHDLIEQMDKQVAAVIDELRDAGELENTFVFYFSDHGGVLPRSKGYLYESGLHVPLVIRVPENFKDLVDRDLGSRTQGFVEFVDFGPTVLNLAGIDPSEKIDGNPFLGPGIDASEVDERNETFGYADRMDEKYDLVRSIRIGDWKYIRHFEPIYSDSFRNEYRYQMLALEQWQTMFLTDKLTDVQEQFFLPHAKEAIYDLSIDPHETKNLANDPQHRGQLLSMRDRLMDRLREMPDTSFTTEVYLVDGPLEDAAEFGQESSSDISRYIDTVNLGLQTLAEVKPILSQAIEDDDALVRHWAIVAALSMGEEAAELLPIIERRLVDLEPLVCVRAAEFCAIHNGKDPRPFVYRSLNRSITEAEALWCLRTAIFFQDQLAKKFPLELAQCGLDNVKLPDKSPANKAIEHLNRKSK
jgi:arylsulfatase A-like enzyme